MDHSADSFGTFLEVLQGKKSPEQDSSHSALRLVEILALLGATPVRELWTRSELDLVSFAKALTVAKTAGLLMTTGSVDDEVAELTPSGTSLASIARSAS
jgi:hypothetical protein